MKEKEKLKKENKFSLLDGLVLLSGIFAAVAIVYTAYWYVDINEKDEEVVISEMEEVYVYNTSDCCYRIIKSAGIKTDDCYINQEVYGCEPKKIIKREVSENDYNYQICNEYYYSTELEAKTIFSYYNEDFENVSVNGNVITWICE